MGEIGFAIIIAILGLVLFGLLIGNMQVSLSDSTSVIEKNRVDIHLCFLIRSRIHRIVSA